MAVYAAMAMSLCIAVWSRQNAQIEMRYRGPMTNVMVANMAMVICCIAESGRYINQKRRQLSPPISVHQDQPGT